MVARVWAGITREAQAGDYLAYLKRMRVKAHRATAGNGDVYVLQRVYGGRAEFVLLSLWESWEAIRNFARGNLEKEASYPTDKDFLLEFDSKVTLYKVLIQPWHGRCASIADAPRGPIPIWFSLERTGSP